MIITRLELLLCCSIFDLTRKKLVLQTKATIEAFGEFYHQVLKNTNEFFQNYEQHKFGISANYFFPFISFAKCIVVTDIFGGKCYLIF